MTADLDPRDITEVRRRVVDPIAKTLLSAEELDEVLVSISAIDFPGLGLVDALQIAVKARGEWLRPSTAWFVGDDLWHAEDFASDLYGSLQDEIAESQFAWGQLRHGEYEVQL